MEDKGVKHGRRSSVEYRYRMYSSFVVSWYVTFSLPSVSAEGLQSVLENSACERLRTKTDWA